jgi:hypothetical protein
VTSTSVSTLALMAASSSCFPESPNTADQARPVLSPTADRRDNSPRRHRNAMSACHEIEDRLLAVPISCGGCRESCRYIKFSLSILYSTLKFESGVATRSVRKCIFTYGRRNSTLNVGAPSLLSRVRRIICTTLMSTSSNRFKLPRPRLVYLEQQVHEEHLAPTTAATSSNAASLRV